MGAGRASSATSGRRLIAAPGNVASCPAGPLPSAQRQPETRSDADRHLLLEDEADETAASAASHQPDVHHSAERFELPRYGAVFADVAIRLRHSHLVDLTSYASSRTEDARHRDAAEWTVAVPH